MKTNDAISSLADSSLTIANLDRLQILEMQVRRMASEHPAMASEHASMARKLTTLESSSNAHRNGNGASLLESESTALTDRRGC